MTTQQASDINPRAIAAAALSKLAQGQSAWTRAEMLAAIDRQLAETYLLDPDGLEQLQQSAIEAAQGQSISFCDEGVDVEGLRHYTSHDVIATDEAVAASLKRRAQTYGRDGEIEVDRGLFTLTDAQAAAARSIAGTHQLVVIEGAAGTGKTTLLKAAQESIEAEGRRLVAVSPIKIGAIQMAKELDAEGNSVHALLYRAGATFDEHGNWTIPDEWKPQESALVMDEKTVLVVDEAGVLDMKTAEALHRYCDDTGVQMVLLGDRKQMSAVGRGGYLPKAVHSATVAHDLEETQRFQVEGAKKRTLDEEYAAATLTLRQQQDAEGFFDLLDGRERVCIGEADEVVDGVARTVGDEILQRRSSIAVASTNAVAQRVNHAVYAQLVEAKEIDASVTATGRGGDPIAAGAKVATRQNDSETAVANRQTWIVQRVLADGRVVLADEVTKLHTTVNKSYVQEHLQLAYAVTAHGAQGMTVDSAHVVLSQQMDSAAAYVGLTRGRYRNTLHVVGVDMEDAKAQFVEAIDRRYSDAGLDAAREKAALAMANAEDRFAGLSVEEAMAKRTAEIEAERTLSDPAAVARVAAREEQVELRKRNRATDDARKARRSLIDSQRDKTRRATPEGRAAADAEVAAEAARAEAAADIVGRRNAARLVKQVKELGEDPKKVRTWDDLSAITRQKRAERRAADAEDTPRRTSSTRAEQSAAAPEERERTPRASEVMDGARIAAEHVRLTQQEVEEEQVEEIAAPLAVEVVEEAPVAVEEPEVVEEAPAVEEPGVEARERSLRDEATLRELARGSEKRYEALRALGAINYVYAGQTPDDDDEFGDRQVFEGQVDAGRCGGRSLLEADGVRELMSPDVYDRIMQRVRQGEERHTSEERHAALGVEIAELTEYQRERDVYGLERTGAKVDLATRSRDWYGGHITQIKEDRRDGLYTDRSSARLEHESEMAAEHAALTAATADVRATGRTLARDNAQAKEQAAKAAKDQTQFE